MIGMVTKQGWVRHLCRDGATACVGYPGLIRVAGGAWGIIEGAVCDESSAGEALEIFNCLGSRSARCGG
jgi:hypothetical protein